MAKKYLPKHLDGKGKRKKQKPEKPERKRKRSLKVLKKVLLAGLFLSLAFILFGVVYVFSLDDWKALDPDKILKAPQSLVIYDKYGQEYSVLSGKENRIWVELDRIPEHVKNAFLAAEDLRYYDHVGIDIIRIGGAIIEDIKAGGYVQGASTIPQQLIKLSHLTGEKAMERKIQEAIMAIELESRFSKDDILEMYLNYVYFGGGFYGIEAAARGYFGVNVEQLTVAQGALLAGVLKSPSNYAPHLNMENSIRRRNLILSIMQENGFLTEAEYQRYKGEEVVLHQEKAQSMKRRGYFVDEVLKRAAKILNISLDELLNGGYRIYTTVDANIQQYCEDVFNNAENFPSQDVQGALVVVDAPSATVAAMVGGRNQEVAMGFNRAVDIRRQPGSIIKPLLVYAPALEHFGYTAASMVLDEQTDFNGYVPANAGQRYQGWVTLREAVAKSLNVPAVRVLDNIGVTSGKLFAQRLGIEFEETDNGLALALGGFTYGVSPLQVAGAYACFAAGGMYKEPSMILSITDTEGNVYYQDQKKPTRVMTEQNAYILNSMLQSAIKSGTGRRLSELNIPLAGKTGTVGDTNSNRDAWMVAYNPQYSIAAWLGYDSNESGALGTTVSGGSYPAELIKQVYAHMYEGKPAPNFIMPPGVSEYRLDRFSLENEHIAVLATAYTPSESIMTELFVDGTEPKEKSEYWSIPTPPDDFSIISNHDGLPYILFTPKSEHIVYALYRQKGDQITVIKEFSGSLNQVLYVDESAQYDVEYEYYIVPKHPSMVIGNQAVVGAASIKISFMPRRVMMIQRAG